MQKFTLGIKMELHISPQNSAPKRLREFGYDDSGSAPKTDEQRKKNLRSVYELMKYDLEEVPCSAFTINGLSGDNLSKLGGRTLRFPLREGLDLWIYTREKEQGWIHDL